jgi:hypothetical protein
MKVLKSIRRKIKGNSAYKFRQIILPQTKSESVEPRIF